MSSLASNLRFSCLGLLSSWGCRQTFWSSNVLALHTHPAIHPVQLKCLSKLGLRGDEMDPPQGFCCARQPALRAFSMPQGISRSPVPRGCQGSSLQAQPRSDGNQAGVPVCSTRIFLLLPVAQGGGAWRPHLLPGRPVSWFQLARSLVKAPWHQWAGTAGPGAGDLPPSSALCHPYSPCRPWPHQLLWKPAGGDLSFQ